jgi:hypothetical protein
MSSCQLFLGSLLYRLVSKFILKILFSSILCTCPNHCNYVIILYLL